MQKQIENIIDKRTITPIKITTKRLKEDTTSISNPKWYESSILSLKLNILFSFMSSILIIIELLFSLFISKFPFNNSILYLIFWLKATLIVKFWIPLLI